MGLATWHAKFTLPSLAHAMTWITHARDCLRAVARKVLARVGLVERENSMARSPTPKRSDGVGKTTRGKGTKLMVLVDGQGIPLGAPQQGTLTCASVVSASVTSAGKACARAA